MTKRRDLTGFRFGRLVALKCVGPYKAKPASEPKLAWRCKCDCGKEVDVVRGSLVSGLTLSCGCLNREKAASRSLTHGGSHTDIYRTWQHMIGRCHRKSDGAWKDYGGRGISVCKEWRNDFKKFAEYIGQKPSPRHSIDRINNDGNYEPGNVRWATAEQQARNKRKPKRKTHCKRGHGFTERNTYWVVQKNGKTHQSCRTCRQIAEKKRQMKRRRNR